MKIAVVGTGYVGLNRHLYCAELYQYALYYQDLVE